MRLHIELLIERLVRSNKVHEWSLWSSPRGLRLRAKERANKGIFSQFVRDNFARHK